MAHIRLIKPEHWDKNNDVWRHGCSLYVVQEGQSNRLKIGIADHPIRRLSILQCGNSRKLYLRTAFCGEREYCRAIEKAIHLKFINKRILNEWFAIPLDEVLTEIEVYQ